MRKHSSLRWRLLWNLALLLVVLMLASGLSAYWNGREAADTAYDRTLLASARTIAAGLSQRDGTLSADHRAALEAHVAVCHNCAAFGGVYGALAGALRQRLTTDGIEPEVATRLRDRLAAEPEPT